MIDFIENNWNNGRGLEPRLELVKFLRESSPELKQLSNLTLIRLIKDSQVINLNPQKPHYTIPDSQNIGFYLVLYGDCNLILQV